MSGCRTDARCGRKSRGTTPGIETAAGVFRVALLFAVPLYPTGVLGELAETVRAEVVVRTDDALGGTISDTIEGDKAGTVAAGLCNPLDVCGDPDCSTAAKCTAGCFGNPVCAPRCGGSPCNVGCSPCDAGCPEECNPLVCPTNALCASSCGGNSCNVGCSPCDAGCPQECDPILCPQNILDCIWALLNSVSNRVDTTIDRATVAKDRATEVAADAGEMVDNMHDGASNLTGEMRERMQDAVAALQQAVIDELAGATDFTGGPNSCSVECEAFRSDIVTLLSGIQDISNALLGMAGINGQADFSREIDFVDSLSGRALFPFYRVIQTLPVLDDDFLNSISEIAAGLEEIAPYLEDTVGARGAPLDVCRLLADNDTLLERIITIATNIDKVGKGLKMAGAVLNAIGKSKIGGRGGVWGWAGVKYTSGLLERFGGHLESLANRLEPIAKKLEKKLQYCVLKVNEEDIIQAIDDKHAQFMKTDQAILDVLEALQAQENGADLNDDGAVDLEDYSLFFSAFGSTGG